MWHQPPRIEPNYGKHKTLIPRSNISQVLLHDNVNQQQMLHVELANILTDHKRRQRLNEQRRKTFIIQQSFKQQQLRALGIHHLSFLPESVAQAHLHMARFTSLSSSKQGVKITEHMPKVSRSRSQSAVKDTSQSVEFTTSSLENEDNYPKRLISKRSLSAFPAKLPPCSDKFLTHDFQQRREQTLAVPEARHMNNNMASHLQCGIKDPRFQSLQSSLSGSWSSKDTFLQLSPSGRDVMLKYGDKPLYDYSFLKDMLVTYGGVDKSKFMQVRNEDQKENVNTCTNSSINSKCNKLEIQ